MRKLFSSDHSWFRFHSITDQMFKSTNRYITLKTYVSLLTAGLSYLVPVIIGVDYAFLWAFLIFLFLTIFPTLVHSIFAMLQFGSFWSFLWVLVFVEAIQLVVGNYIEPKIMGKSLNQVRWWL